MRLEGRRGSDNVEDRRGQKMSGGKASLGIGGAIVVGVIVWLMGGNPLDVVQQIAINPTVENNYVPSAEDEQTVVFIKAVLASTEDVWSEIFQQHGAQYIKPKMVLFNSHTTSGCGSASASTGPFYCSADQAIYLDLSFFKEMDEKLKAGGDFAYAYVIAHEVGHHVQYLLGTLTETHQQQRIQSTAAKRNQLSVKLELQADFYAGVWAHQENRQFRSLEEGDIEEGLNAASQIGDDRLQMNAQGYTVPDAFNHGTSAQRVRWLKKGLTSGNIAEGNTFALDYSQL